MSSPEHRGRPVILLREALHRLWIRSSHRLRRYLLEPVAWTHAMFIRTRRETGRLATSRMSWLLGALVLACVSFAWPSVSGIYGSENGYAVLLKLLIWAGAVAVLLCQWAFPDKPLAVPGYAIAYLGLVIGYRAIRKARHHAWRVQPFRASDGHGAIGMLIASQFRNVIEALRRRRWDPGPILISETGVVSTLTSRPFDVPVQLVGSPVPADVPEVEVAGLSPKTLEDLARYLLGTETVLTGDLNVGDSQNHHLSVRVPGVGEWRSVLKYSAPEWSEPELRSLALRVLRDAEPLAYVGYLVAQKQAKEALDYLIAQGARGIPKAQDWKQAVEFSASVASWQLRGTEAALEAEEQGLAAVPGSAVIRNASAIRLLVEGRQDDAIAAATAAIRSAPWSVAPRLTLANAYTAKGDPLQALRPALMAYWLSSSSRQAIRVTLGRIYLGLGEKEKAARHLRYALKMSPTDALPRVYLSHLTRSSRESFGLLQDAVRLAPQNVTAHFALGHLLADLGRFEDAAVSFRTVVDLAPQNADSHFWLYLALDKLERKEEAAQELQIARDLGSAYARDFLGRVDFSKKAWD